jgi:hypothetical protein
MMWILQMSGQGAMFVAEGERQIWIKLANSQPEDFSNKPLERKK